MVRVVTHNDKRRDTSVEFIFSKIDVCFHTVSFTFEYVNKVANLE